MTSPSFVPGQTLELTIEKVAAGGQGMALLEGLPIFILGAIPGQKIQAMITKSKENFAEGKLVKVIKTAPGEIKPRCKHFWDCGGCVWQHLPYDRQILYKENIVKETLEHLTPAAEKVRKSLPGRVLSIIPSPQVFYYRNKLELSFGVDDPAALVSENGAKRVPLETPSLGFHQPNQWATILPITE